MPEVSISEHARKTRHPGRLFLVTAPSGAGKSSLVNALLARQPNIKLSISNTTRDPRPGEVNGREYHFVTEDMFLEMKSRGEFLESAYVHGHYYGTSRPWIESQMARGNDVLPPAPPVQGSPPGFQTVQICRPRPPICRGCSRPAF